MKDSYLIFSVIDIITQFLGKVNNFVVLFLCVGGGFHRESAARGHAFDDFRAFSAKTYSFIFKKIYIIVYKSAVRQAGRTRARLRCAMNYIKKLCILKQLSSGFAADGKKVSALLTAESFAGRLTLTLAMIGFAPLSQGRYRLLVCDEHGEKESFEIPSAAGLTVKKNSPLNIADGFGCLICFAGTRMTPVAFGKCGDRTYDVKKMCAALDEEETPSAKIPAETAANANLGKAGGESASSSACGGTAQRNGGENQPHRPPAAPDGGTDAAPADSRPAYDDEVVATENYFEFDDVDRENLTIREKCDGNSDEERGKAKGSEEIAGKDEDAQSLFRFAGSENLREDAGACYYDQVKGELSELFTNHPAEEELEKCVPFSRWARVTFARNKYYTVGVISDEKRPKYICYGVPAEKRGEPPDALKGKCSFLPLSLFDPDGKGYWMMFQDAETGHCVKISQK